MRVKFATAMLLLVLSAGLNAQQAQTVKNFNNTFSMSLPFGFEKLGEGDVAKLYPAADQRPNVVYMVKAKDLLVSLNLTDKKTEMQPIIAHKDILSAGMKRHPSVQWIGEEVKTINGKQYIVFSFTKTSPTGETDLTKMFITSLTGRMLMGTITIKISGTLTDAQKADVDAILASLKM